MRLYDILISVPVRETYKNTLRARPLTGGGAGTGGGAASAVRNPVLKWPQGVRVAL